jgi:ParB family chromosome partitioning protein
MKGVLKSLQAKDLHPFEQNPFRLRDDPELQASVADLGVLVPLLVRPRAEGNYEIISGHQRRAACENAGITMVPAIVRDLDDAAAAIALVDSNLHRERVLPSEKAFAYKLKLDALKHQGATCGQLGHKSRDLIADSDSGRQVQRYIRLTTLLAPILELVDSGKMALGPAVELSYLAEKEQLALLERMQSEERTPSFSQAQRLRKMSVLGDKS